LKEFGQQMKSQWFPLQEDFLQAAIPGGGASRLADNLLGLKAANGASDIVTDSAIVALALAQEPDGNWDGSDVQNRPPLLQSPFAATVRAIRALQDFGIPARKQEFADRIASARSWLLQTKPLSTEDFAMRLSGLTYSGAADREVAGAAKALLALQRPDGSWGANPYKTGDAYATGGALIALAESKAVQVSDAAYKRGVEYLLSTQFPDGAWHVQSRSIKFQPYFESGFPFGHDQWISCAGTSLAAQAISLSLQGGTVSVSAR
jgi:hypothetical protein